MRDATTKQRRGLASLSVREWAYLATAVMELGLARYRHATRPSGKIIDALQLPLGGSPARRWTLRWPFDLEMVSWAIPAAAARVPWRSDCLLQAMAADRWMRRHGLQPEFYLAGR